MKNKEIENCPAFFIIFMSQECGDKLKIPPSFLRSIEGVFPESVELRNRYGNKWHVKVKQVGSLYYFIDGWKTFHVENLVVNMDLVVFYYHRGGLFNVKFLGRSAIEKIRVEGPESTNAEKEFGRKEGENAKLVRIETEVNVEEKEDTDTDDNVCHMEHRDREEENDGQGQQENDCNFNVQFRSATEKKRVEGPESTNAEKEVDRKEGENAKLVKIDTEVNMEEKEDTDTEVNMEEKEDTDTDDNVRHMEHRDHEEENDDQGQQVNDSATNERPTRRKRSADWYRRELFESGLFPEPEHPYFVTKARLHRSCELYIPLHLVKNPHINLPVRIEMVDPCGRTFWGDRNIWKGGRTNYVGGWKSLLKSNAVGLNDMVICEFKPGARGQPYIEVSFVRAVREG